ncbi:MAG: hypothetical protein BWY21_01857 [Parcubacteria group bacterium ADurb.Bin216]|jgi:hypothetical protein|nr:MAG: hypothetical protein BWY21_01857 [Parcubacteria group bacterium ADurb.Bin216]
MEDFVSTDLGLINRDNANWAYTNGLINKEGRLLDKPILGIGEKWVQLYSYFRWVIQDIKSRIPTPPAKVTLGTDEFIELMRTGKLERGEGEDFYHAHYTPVEDLVRAGKQACVDAQPQTKRKEFDWDSI